MKTIQIAEWMTLNLWLPRYIILNLGLNIEPGKAAFDEKNKAWKVQ